MNRPSNHTDISHKLTHFNELVLSFIQIPLEDVVEIVSNVAANFSVALIRLPVLNVLIHFLLFLRLCIRRSNY